MTVFRMLAVVLAGLLASPAHSQVEHQDYRLLAAPQPPTTQGKIEVLEFFSYACPHCYSLQPLISKWAAQLPANVAFIRIPVSFGRREWGQLSRTYYALQATGDLARLDDALFDAIHQHKRPLFDAESIVAWAMEQGVDAAAFRAQLESAAVSAKGLRAEQMSREYQVTGVPYIVVEGKYVVLGKTHEDTLRIARLLIDKAAGEKRSAKR